MSGHWIQIGDTRVNVSAQAPGPERFAVLACTLALYTPPCDQDDREPAFRCTPGSIATEHAAEMLELYATAGAVVRS